MRFRLATGSGRLADSQGVVRRLEADEGGRELGLGIWLGFVAFVFAKSLCIASVARPHAALILAGMLAGRGSICAPSTAHFRSCSVDRLGCNSEPLQSKGMSQTYTSRQLAC